MKKINIGVIGCANIATRSVIPTIFDLNKHFQFIGAASRNVEKSQEIAEIYNANIFNNYSKLINHSDLDAVYIPLPNSLHAEWIKRSLNSNLHVLVEKSMACKYEDVLTLNELAKKKELVLIENFQFRFHNQLHKISDLIDDGVIGDIRCIKSSFGFPNLPNENDIRYNKELGGGSLLDTGAYPLKIAQFFLGYDIEVKAANLNSIPGKEVDIWGGAYLKQKAGDLFAEISFGFNNFYQCSIEFWGNKGLLYTNRIFTAGKDHNPVIEIETVAGKESITLPADDHFKNMLLHFYKLINSKKGRSVEYQQNINQARLIDQLKKKANE